MSTVEKEVRTIVVVGGGITGMAAAYTVQQKARQTGQAVRFVLVEASQRLGGKIISERVDDFLVDGGPDCFIRQKPWASDLCLELGLGDQLIGTNDKQRKVYVLNHGKLAPLPDGVMLIIPTRFMPFVTSTLISWPGKIRMGMDLFIPRRKDDEDESVGSFVRRRLGTEALDKIAEPLMSGIHVSDPEKQSVLATFPRFRNIEKKHGSLIKGMLAQRRTHTASQQPAAPSKVPASMFVSLQGGLGQMVDSLAAALTDGQVLCGVKVSRLERQPAGDYQVTLDNGEQIAAEAVILAAPAYVSSELVQEVAPQAAREMAAIRYVSTATVSVAYRKADIHKPFVGHGLVIPKKENREISACTWTSLKFNHRAPEDYLLLRCFVGGPGQEERVDLSDAAMLELVKRELKALLKIDAEPQMARIYRWHKANPQYEVGHLDRVKAMHAGLETSPGLYAAGSAFDGVGVPDCVHQGQEAARKAIDYVAELENQRVKTSQ